MARPRNRKHSLKYKALCDRLLEVDPNIVEIDLFGSSAYAPEVAQDVDLLVTTRRKKRIDRYWDATGEWPMHVDVLVRSVRESVSPDIAYSVAGCGQAIYGSGEVLKEVREKMAVPTFDEARKVLVAADKYLSDAHETIDSFLKHQPYRTTFNTIFEAARHAVMTSLNTDETRWGELRRGLPQELGERFRKTINICHVQYWYEGRYPKDRVDVVYAQWRETVSQFIDELEQ
ncbi:MAG: hypothetical protein HY318_19820, partial [Armatimonadetes bacterium]|nr:hypothetical protein [Armatimonadota bacterium]